MVGQCGVTKGTQTCDATVINIVVWQSAVTGLQPLHSVELIHASAWHVSLVRPPHQGYHHVAELDTHVTLPHPLTAVTRITVSTHKACSCRN